MQEIRQGVMLWENSQVKDEHWVTITSGEVIKTSDYPGYNKAYKVPMLVAPGHGVTEAVPVIFTADSFGKNRMVEEMMGIYGNGPNKDGIIDESTLPLFMFDTDSYIHKEHGRVKTPRATFKKWASVADVEKMRNEAQPDEYERAGEPEDHPTTAAAADIDDGDIPF